MYMEVELWVVRGGSESKAKKHEKPLLSELGGIQGCTRMQIMLSMLKVVWYIRSGIVDVMFVI